MSKGITLIKMIVIGLGELTEVQGTCVDWGKGAAKRFCPAR
jgi:hypothetical protein